MAKTKTTWTGVKVSEFIDAVPDERKRADSYELIDMMKKETGFEPEMWGPTIVGFGKYHYKYESGHEGDTPKVGFSPRKDALTLYLMFDPEKREKMLQKLGKHKVSKACVYIKKLEDVDTKVLKEMVRMTVSYTDKLYPGK